MIPTPTSGPLDMKRISLFHWQVQLSSQLINYFLKDFLKALVEGGFMVSYLNSVSMLFVFFSCELTLLLKLINNSYKNTKEINV